MGQEPRDIWCNCGSGKKYENCCGSVESLRWNEQAFGRVQGNLLSPELAHFVSEQPSCQFDGKNIPPGILILKLGAEYALKKIASEIISTEHTKEALVTVDGTGKKAISNRVTDIVEMGEMEQPVIELVRRAYAKEVEPFFNCKLRSLETPQVLRYTRGSCYHPHADADVMDRETLKWKKSRDRDYSLLIYLDEDYVGGELIFPNFDFKLKPQADMLVAFPSDFRYLHGAMPVLSGVRHAIVSWCAIKR